MWSSGRRRCAFIRWGLVRRRIALSYIWRWMIGLLIWYYPGGIIYCVKGIALYGPLLGISFRKRSFSFLSLSSSNISFIKRKQVDSRKMLIKKKRNRIKYYQGKLLSQIKTPLNSTIIQHQMRTNAQCIDKHSEMWVLMK